MRIKITVRPQKDSFKPLGEFEASAETAFDFWDFLIGTKFYFGTGYGETVEEAVLNAKRKLLEYKSQQDNKKVFIDKI